jgi:hypothetical protein
MTASEWPIQLSSVGIWKTNTASISSSEPVGVDATIFAFVAGTLCQHFDTPLRTEAERYDNLRRYVGRMTARYYPDLGEIAGCKAAA